ncbi:MAG: S1 RNA-binding domain-containing protein [Planctomycetota bacterium]
MTANKNNSKDPLSAEIEAALDGVELQHIDSRSPSGSQATRSGDNKAKPGAKRNTRGMVPGLIVGVHGDDVIVELSPTSQGICPRAQFENEPKVGERSEFTLGGQDPDGLWILSRRELQALAAWDSIEKGSRVEAKVTGQNTGGLELKIGPLPAFMPASQLGLGREDNLAQYIGKTLEVQVMEIDSERRRLTVSRRAILESEREAAREKNMGSMTIGQVIRGRVTRVEKFGAFVDIGGGVEGLLHVSNLSRGHVADPNDVVKKGQELEVMVLKIEEGGKRIALGTKQLEADPWQAVGGRYQVDQVVNGKVVRLTEFGAFVEIEPGVDGLLHVSAMGKERVRRPQDVLKVGEEVSVRIVTIDSARQRLSLSRLDPRGAMIGSEDSVDTKVIDEAVARTQASVPQGTNLGSLFKKALDKKG